MKEKEMQLFTNTSQSQRPGCCARCDTGCHVEAVRDSYLLAMIRSGVRPA